MAAPLPEMPPTGLAEGTSTATPVTPRPSLLAGLDARIDQRLNISTPGEIISDRPLDRTERIARAIGGVLQDHTTRLQSSPRPQNPLPRLVTGSIDYGFSQLYKEDVGWLYDTEKTHRRRAGTVIERYMVIALHELEDSHDAYPEIKLAGRLGLEWRRHGQLDKVQAAKLLLANYGLRIDSVHASRENLRPNQLTRSQRTLFNIYNTKGYDDDEF